MTDAGRIILAALTGAVLGAAGMFGYTETTESTPEKPSSCYAFLVLSAQVQGLNGILFAETSRAEQYSGRDGDLRRLFDSCMYDAQ
jgi:hypothetical protein